MDDGEHLGGTIDLTVQHSFKKIVIDNFFLYLIHKITKGIN